MCHGDVVCSDGRNGLQIIYRQTLLGEAELMWLQDEIDNTHGLTRQKLAARACEHFGWYRPNGKPAIASCAVFVGRIEKRGWLRFAQGARAPLTSRRRQIRDDHADILEWLGPLPGIVESQPDGPLCVRPIADEEYLGFRLHMRRYHYLGFEKSVGESVRYAAFLGDELVALLDWGAAVLHNGPRDEFIGWGASIKERRIAWVVNNRRFLVLPWIHQKCLASRVLAANLRRLNRDWEALYGHSVWLAETFVDATRFQGICYQASNWILLGKTQGFSRSRTGFFRNECPKSVFVFPLHRQFRRLLVGKA